MRIFDPIRMTPEDAADLAASIAVDDAIAAGVLLTGPARAAARDRVRGAIVRARIARGAAVAAINARLWAAICNEGRNHL